MKLSISWLWLSLALAVGSVAPSYGSTESTSPGMAAAHPANHAVENATLSQYHWQLAQARDHRGQPINTLLTKPDKPLQIDFQQGRLRVSHACNAMSGRYTIDQQQLTIDPMIHTMMACSDHDLMAMESAVTTRLRGTLQIHLQASKQSPQLQLITPGGDVLQFTGKPTAEARYHGPGKVEFLEVAGHAVPCHSHPGAAGTTCLRVRERHYNAQGLQSDTPGPWHVLAPSIQGFTPQDGVRFVLRVKRYSIKHAPADGSSTAYVLDSIVESGPAATP